MDPVALPWSAAGSPGGPSGNLLMGGRQEGDAGPSRQRREGRGALRERGGLSRTCQAAGAGRRRLRGSVSLRGGPAGRRRGAGRLQ